MQLSDDHTYVNALVKAGIITKEEARHRSDKHKITKAVGAEPDVRPDFFHIKYTDNCKLLLCTDGLHDEVSDEEIAKVFAKGMSMSDTCDVLVDMANEYGGNDNITVICIDLTEESKDE